MYYELYIDTLFLINFVMNLFVLLLVNRSARRTATRLRMIGSALLGAFIYCLCFVIPHVHPWVKLAAGTALSGGLMVQIAFKPVTLRAGVKLIETLTGYSFLMGGILMFFMKYMQGFSGKSMGMAAVLGLGSLTYQAVTYAKERRKKEKREFCKVTLRRGECSVTVDALVDTGNGLTEPISGKPVSVVEEEVLQNLWPEGLPELFRAVPYHSVGCAHGIMKGYEVPEAVVEIEGFRSTVHQIYLGADKNKISVSGSYGMILNPRLLGGN